MNELRQIIQRLRLGETDRSIARSQQVGRRKVAQIRVLPAAQNWLDAALLIPDDALIVHYKSSTTAAIFSAPAGGFRCAEQQSNASRGHRCGSGLRTIRARETYKIMGVWHLTEYSTAEMFTAVDYKIDW